MVTSNAPAIVLQCINTNSLSCKRSLKRRLDHREEVEIGTNVKLNPLYIASREIEFMLWTTRVIQPILIRGNDQSQQLGATKLRFEIADTIEFENILNERVQELNLKLKESDNLRESDILINEIDTLESTLGRLSDLKYGDKVRAIEIAKANNLRI